MVGDEAGLAVERLGGETVVEGVGEWAGGGEEVSEGVVGVLHDGHAGAVVESPEAFVLFKGVRNTLL